LSRKDIVRIAPRFNAGNVVAEQFSPEGTLEFGKSLGVFRSVFGRF